MFDHVQLPEEFSRLQLRDLILFDQLFQTRSLTEAATSLNLTLPSAGRLLNKLRVALDDQLFTRGGTGLVPTDKAVILSSKISRLLSVYHEISEGDVFLPEKLTKTFNIAIADNALAELFPDVLNDLFQHSPNINLSIKVIDNTLYSRLRSGELDCAILPNFDLPDATFHKMIIGSGYCSLYVRKNHPLALKVKDGLPVSVADVDQYPQIRIAVRSVKGRMLGSIDQGLFMGKGHRKTVIELPYFFSSIQLVEKSDLTVVLPNFIGNIASSHQKIVHIPVADAPERIYQQTLVWHDRVHLDPGNQYLRSTIVNGARFAFKSTGLDKNDEPFVWNPDHEDAIEEVAIGNLY